MNLRCFYCQTPFTLGRAEILAALERMDAEHMNHYDAHCPRCRRANSVSRQRLEMFLPNWREAAAEQAAMPPAPMEEKPAPVEEKPMPMAVAQPTAMVPSEAQLPAAPKDRKPARKRAGSAKKTPAKPSAKAPTKKPSAAKAKAKPAAKSKAAATSSPKGKPASKAKKTTAKSKKK